MNRPALTFAAVATLCCVASPAPLAPPSASAQEKVVVANALPTGDRRTVVVHKSGSATHPVDEVVVMFKVRSGVAPPELAAAQIEELERAARDHLTAASVPLGRATFASPETEAHGEGNVHVERRVEVVVADFDAADRAIAALAPLVGRPNTIDSRPGVMDTPKAYGRSTKFNADRAATEAEAKREALRAARAEAELIAKELGVRVGPPVHVGKITLGESWADRSPKRGFSASVEVVFELIADGR